MAARTSEKYKQTKQANAYLESEAISSKWSLQGHGATTRNIIKGLQHTVAMLQRPRDCKHCV